MIRPLTLIVLLNIAACIIYGQDDCRKYIQQDRIDACKVYNESFKYFELSRQYVDVLNQSLSIDTTYSLPYRDLANTYARLGDPVKWKSHMDKSIQNDTINIVERVYDYFYHFAEYEMALIDIGRIEKHSPALMYTIKDVHYNLQFVKGLCYKGLGQSDRGIYEMETLLYSERYWPMDYDILHLGVMYLNTQQFDKALEVLTVQRENFGLAETEFYLAQIYQQLGDTEMFDYHIRRCQSKYYKKEFIHHPDVSLMDEISILDIDLLLSNDTMK